MEEIEELRAKAIASMPSSFPLNPNPKSVKSPASREEGELSSSSSELPTCSAAAPTASTLNEQPPVVVMSTHTQVKTLPGNSSSMANVPRQTSATPVYSKHFKTKQVPFKSSNRRSLSWHGKGSDNNLVISFSDDDSKSDPEECIPEETISRKEDIARVNKPPMTMASMHGQSEGLQVQLNRTTFMPKKGFNLPASTSCNIRVRGANTRPLLASSEKDSVIPRHYPNLKTSARQEHGPARDANLADHRLESLRHEIAVRENELKVQSKSVPESKESNISPYSSDSDPNIMKLETKAAGYSRPISVISVELAPNEQVKKRLKLDGCYNSTRRSDCRIELLSPSNKSAHELNGQLVENSNSLKDRDTMECHKHDKEKLDSGADTTLLSNGLLDEEDGSRPSVHVHETRASNPYNAKVSKNENQSMLISDASCSYHESEKRDVALEPTTNWGQKASLEQIAPMVEDAPLCKIDVPTLGHRSIETLRHTDISRQVDASNLFPSTAPQSIGRTQQIAEMTDVRIPMERSKQIIEKRSVQVSESKSGNDKINMSGVTSVDLQSLVELEETQDRELEEAQEHRRRCELEERRALKAYQKAQRALIEANQRCSLIYRKRELFSAQLRSSLMEASTSMLPSSWQSKEGTVSEYLKAASEANFDQLSNLGHQLPAQDLNLGNAVYESNTTCYVDAPLDASCQQMNGHDFCRSGDRDNNALDGICTPAHHSSMSPDDDDNFPLDKRYVQSRLLRHITEGSHGQKNAIVNAGTKKSPTGKSSPNYEAYLRSKLVARFSRRMSSKGNDIRDAECPAQGRADKNRNEKSFSLLDQQVQKGGKIQSLDFEGAEISARSTSLPNAKLHSQSCDSHLLLNDEAHMSKDPEDNNSFPRDSGWPIQTTVFSLPSSVLHITSRHVKFILPGCHSKLSTTEVMHNMLTTSLKEVTDCEPDVEESTTCYSMRPARTGDAGFRNCNLAINPILPFCMYELRGKCNNEECRWQHVKNCKERYAEHNELSALYYADSQVNKAGTVGKSNDAFGSCHDLFHDILSVPTYLIGSNLIKVDPYLTRSVLARCIWQYWQRGFCASFSLPISVQRILPPDAPFLQTGDGPIADDNSWSKFSLYYQTLDGTMKQFMQGLPESEESLEKALNIVDGEVYKPDRKEALSSLARSIETDPSSVVHWVLYLHIFYGKEKNIGKDDMFVHAVQNNKDSYELWLMYINSRMKLGDRLDAYDYALTTICHSEKAFEKNRNYMSACVLDIFLQMIDCLCMSGDVQKTIQRIYVLLLEDSGDTYLSVLYSRLVISDRCIFWFCCIYLAIYRKLPEEIVRQFEFEKDLPFGVEWSPAHLTTDVKVRALDLMKLAVDKMALDKENNPHKSDLAALRSLHFLAVNHVKCVTSLEGAHCSAGLLAKYLELYPTCIELVLISCRLKEESSGVMALKGFEEAISNWPKEIPGIQCLWNQYAEHALTNRRIDLARNLMECWFQSFSEAKDPHDCNLEGRKDLSSSSCSLPSHVISDEGNSYIKKDDIFGFLNLSLYRILQKDSSEADVAINKALMLATSEDFKHCVREHAAFTFSNGSHSQKDVSFGLVLDIINRYLRDSRSSLTLEPLSRKFYWNIKRPKVRQLVNNLLGPVSRDSTLMNSVLEVCYGPSLLPEKIDDPKAFVDFVESLMQVTPANYKLALSVYRLITASFNHDSVADYAIKFWATSLLINSIFQTIPVAPEHVWLEAAHVLGDSGNSDISLRFYQQAITVYPFSIRLWQSYLSISRSRGNVDTIVETARGRGVELI